MTRARPLLPIGRVFFAIIAAIILRPFVCIFDRVADALYRPRDVRTIDDCVAKVCRMAEGSVHPGRRSIASLMRRSGYRRFQDKVTFELFRDEFRRNPALCTSWQGYSDDIRYSPSWYVDLTGKDGRYLAGYYHNEPAKRKECYYQTKEDACARFLLGFLQEA
jgi:hypothetical protein